MQIRSRLERFLGPLLVALGSFLWSTDAPLRKPLTDQNISSTAIVFTEHLVGFAYSVPLVIKNRAKLLLFEKKHWFSLLFIALGGSVAATWFFTQSFALGNPTVTILTQKIQPLIAVLLAWVILRERIARKGAFVAIAIIAIAAVYFVSFGDANYGPALVDIFQPTTYLVPFTKLGEANSLVFGYALLAAFFWGGSTVFGRLMLTKVSFKLMTALRYFFATIALFAIALVAGVFPEILSLSLGQLVPLLYIGLIPGLLALFIYYMGLRSTKASIATLGELTYPISAVAMNWAFLGLGLTLTQIIGTVVLLAAILLLSLLNSRNSK